MEDPDFDAEYRKLNARHQRYGRLVNRQMWYGFVALVPAFATLGIAILAVKGLSVVFPAAEPLWLLAVVVIPTAAALWAIGRWLRRKMPARSGGSSV
jgi:hypothetical protein